jgi:AAA+ superfamily predicted ATPase
MLDRALFRRFDEVVRFHLPSETEVLELMSRRLRGSDLPLGHLAHLAHGLSFADVQRVSEDALKHALLVGRAKTNEEDVILALQERQHDKKTFSGEEH